MSAEHYCVPYNGIVRYNHQRKKTTTDLTRTHIYVWAMENKQKKKKKDGKNDVVEKSAKMKSFVSCVCLGVFCYFFVIFRKIQTQNIFDCI